MMSPARRATIYTFLAILIGGHAIDIITRHEHWPFSNYPMFSNVADSHLHTYQLTCLYTDSAGVTREVYFNPNWVPTLPQYKIMDLLRHNLDGSKPNPAQLHEMVSDYLKTYDTCRREGLNHGPDIKAIRLYRLDIPLQVPLRQVDFQHDFATIAQMALEIDRSVPPSATRPAESSGLPSVGT